MCVISIFFSISDYTTTFQTIIASSPKLARLERDLQNGKYIMHNNNVHGNYSQWSLAVCCTAPSHVRKSDGGKIASRLFSPPAGLSVGCLWKERGLLSMLAGQVLPDRLNAHMLYQRFRKYRMDRYTKREHCRAVKQETWSFTCACCLADVTQHSFTFHAAF